MELRLRRLTRLQEEQSSDIMILEEEVRHLRRYKKERQEERRSEMKGKGSKEDPFVLEDEEMGEEEVSGLSPLPMSPLTDFDDGIEGGNSD